MKKLLIVCATVVCAFVSCTKDVSKDLIGEWGLTQMHYVEKEDVKVVSEVTEYPNDDLSISVIFKEDGTCKWIVTEDGEVSVNSYDWLYAQDKLIFTEVDYSEEFGVLSCTKKELILVHTDKYGTETSYEDTCEYYFSRL